VVVMVVLAPETVLDSKRGARSALLRGCKGPGSVVERDHSRTRTGLGWCRAVGRAAAREKG
jgi:hypothetical protein